MEGCQRVEWHLPDAHRHTLVGLLGLEGREGEDTSGAVYSLKNPALRCHLEFSMAGWAARHRSHHWLPLLRKRFHEAGGRRRSDRFAVA